ncbi:MAG TPA: hypothetical protein DCQ04_09640 [Actinobacteria bacterium]|jgi:hypothetical protein|nr:hypothetical protein [Actinomycetota bacterium]
MKITPERLGQAAGIAAATAGAIFVAVQINHPPLDLHTVTTTDFMVRSLAKALMSMLALAGITGIYLRQLRQVGLLGLSGYLIFSVGYFLMFGVEFLAAFVLPSLTDSDPQFVSDVLTVAVGGNAVGSIGLMQAVLTISGIGYMLGGLIFGIAVFRAGILARWAAALLAVGTISTVALAVLPESFNRFFALPVGVALIGLGISLWRDQRKQAASAAAAALDFDGDAPSLHTDPIAVR